MINRIAFYHLETLFWIARLGTFNAAAQRLNTSQPAISARIRELEEQLGIAIFQREGRGVALTPRGRLLVRECEPLWARLRETLLGVNERREAGGIVRIGAGEIAAATCLPALVDVVAREWPRVSLDIEIDLTATLMQKLLAGEADIVLLVGPVEAPVLEAHDIGLVQSLWLAAPAVAQQIMRHGAGESALPLWTLARHSPLHRIARETMEELPVATATLHTVNNVRSLTDMVVRGHGIGLLPEAMVRERLNDGTLVPVPGAPNPPVIMFQVAIRREQDDPTVRAIFEHACRLRMPAPGDDALARSKKPRRSRDGAK